MFIAASITAGCCPGDGRSRIVYENYGWIIPESVLTIAGFIVKNRLNENLLTGKNGVEQGVNY